MAARTDSPRGSRRAPSRAGGLTVEERRLDAALVAGGVPVAAQVLAADVAREHGQRLWDTAVDRAQGRLEPGGLDRYDDRPLYWARTSLTAAVRGVEADWLTSGRQRLALVHLLERASRGMARPLWPVVLHDGVCEWPAGTFPDPAALRRRPDPSPGSTAASGSGGDHLSNGSMYRSNRLRQALGAHDVSGGHLHISSLEHPAAPEALTDGAFEADRAAVVDQTVALVAAAGAAVRAARGVQQRGREDVP